MICWSCSLSSHTIAPGKSRFRIFSTPSLLCVCSCVQCTWLSMCLSSSRVFTYPIGALMESFGTISAQESLYRYSTSYSGGKKKRKNWFDSGWLNFVVYIYLAHGIDSIQSIGYAVAGEERGMRPVVAATVKYCRASVLGSSSMERLPINQMALDWILYLTAFPRVILHLSLMDVSPLASLSSMTTLEITPPALHRVRLICRIGRPPCRLPTGVHATRQRRISCDLARRAKRGERHNVLSLDNPSPS